MIELAYPFADLEQYVLGHFPPVDESGAVGIVSLLSLNERNTYYRGKVDGAFSEVTAERIALAFGEMPEMIWPHWANEPVPDLCHWCHTALSKKHGSPMLKECCRRLDAMRQRYAERRIERVSARVSVMTDGELAAFLGLTTAHPQHQVEAA